MFVCFFFFSYLFILHPDHIFSSLYSSCYIPQNPLPSPPSTPLAQKVTEKCNVFKTQRMEGLKHQNKGKRKAATNRQLI